MSARGSAVVEFALVIPLVALVMLGLVEVTVVARSQLEVSQAAREGARQAAAGPDPALAVAAVQRSLGPESAARARVAVSREHRVGGEAEVTVRLRHRVSVPIVGGWSIELVGQAVMRVER